MYRLAIKKLFRWKKKPNRKPLIIEGAGQVGKTWLMKEFGEKAYNHRSAEKKYINLCTLYELH